MRYLQAREGRARDGQSEVRGQVTAPATPNISPWPDLDTAKADFTFAELWVLGSQYADLHAARSEIGRNPTKEQLRECLEFWTHYSSMNEPAQDDIADEKAAMLERMKGWL